MNIGEQRAKELGLILYPNNGVGDCRFCYMAPEVHRALGEGVETTGWVKGHKHGFGNVSSECDTHTALLIGIRPIKPKTVEFEIEVEDTMAGCKHGGVRSDRLNHLIGKRVKVTVTEVGE